MPEPQDLLPDLPFGNAPGELPDLPMGLDPSENLPELPLGDPNAPKPMTFEEAERLSLIPTMDEVATEAAKGANITFNRMKQILTSASGAVDPFGSRFALNPPVMNDPETRAFQAQLEEDMFEMLNDPSESVGGAMVRDLSRFLTAFVPLSAVSAVSGGGPLASVFMAGPAADMIAFPPDEERLSNLMASIDSPIFNNAITQYLSAAPGDPEAEALFKQAVEGILLGGVTEGLGRSFIHAYRGVRGIKRKQLAHTIGVSADSRAMPRSAREELDVVLSDEASKVLNQPFEVKDVKLPGVKPEEAKAQLLTDEFVKRMERLDPDNLLTPTDRIAKANVFREQALKKFKPAPASAQKGANINAAYERNREVIKESKRVTFGQVKERVRRVVTREIIDRSGNLKRRIVEDAGDLGRDAQMRLELAQGASTRAHFHFDAARKNVFGGLTKVDSDLLSQVIMLRRLRTIKTYNPDWDAPIHAGGKGKRPGRKTTAGDYNEALNQLRKEVGETKYAELMGRGDEYFGEMVRALDVLLDAGVVSADEYKRLSRFQYSPIQYLERLDPKMAVIGQGPKAVSIRSSGIKALGKGAEKAITDDPELFMGQVLARAHSTAFRNKANQEMLKIAQGQGSEIVRLKVPKGERGKFAEVSVMVEGERKQFFIANEFVSEWNVDPISISWVPKILALSGAVRPLATGINPEFIMSNFPRDFIFAFLNAGEGTVYSSNLFRGVGQLTKDLIETASDVVKREGVVIDYINEGGGMPLLTHQGRFATLDPLIEKIGPARQAWTEFQQFAGWLNETSELWMRAAVRNRDLKNTVKVKGGGSVTQIDRDRATWTARRYLDFAQGGGAVKRLDQAIPYFNAAVQGFRGFGRAVKTNPKIMAAKISQIMGVFAGGWLANNTLFEEDFAAVPQTIKDTNMIFMTPLVYLDEEGNRRRAYMRIPIDHSVHGIKALTDSLMARSINGELPKDTTMRAMQTLTGIVPGVSGIPSINAMVAIGANVDFWRDEKIWKGDPRIAPEEEIVVTGDRPTSGLAVDVGQLTNMSPERLQVAARSIFPKSIYTDAIGWSYEVMTRGVPEEVMQDVNLKTIRDMPFARRFMGLTFPSTAFRAGLDEAAADTALINKEVYDNINLTLEGFRQENTKPGFTSQQERILENTVEALDPTLQRAAKNYVTTAIKLEDVFKRTKVGEVPGMVDRGTWLAWARSSPRTRAVQFFEHWKVAHVDSVSEDENIRRAGQSRKRVMTQLARSLPGFHPVKSREFGITLQRLAVEEDVPLPR